MDDKRENMRMPRAAGADSAVQSMYGEVPICWLAEGEQFILGQAANEFGIWTRRAKFAEYPGSPIVRFTPGDGGLTAARSKFEAWESMSRHPTIDPGRELSIEALADGPRPLSSESRDDAPVPVVDGHGILGFYELTEWWEESFTPVEREVIESRYWFYGRPRDGLTFSHGWVFEPGATWATSRNLDDEARWSAFLSEMASRLSASAPSDTLVENYVLLFPPEESPQAFLSEMANRLRLGDPYEGGLRKRIEAKVLDLFVAENASAEETDPTRGLYRGHFYGDYVGPVTVLKREGRLDEAASLLEAVLPVVIGHADAEGSPPAPWYFEQLAIIEAKRGNPIGEIRACDAYLNLSSGYTDVREKLRKRRDKAVRKLASTH